MTQEASSNSLHVQENKTMHTPIETNSTEQQNNKIRAKGRKDYPRYRNRLREIKGMVSILESSSNVQGSRTIVEGILGCDVSNIVSAIDELVGIIVDEGVKGLEIGRRLCDCIEGKKNNVI